MNTRIFFSGLLILSAPLALFADSYRITAIRYPGAMGTSPLGLNNLGQVVGGYSPPNSRSGYGFVWSNGQFTNVVDFPGSLYSFLAAINDSGQMLGRYAYRENGYQAYGTFVYTKGSFRTFSVPGATETDGADINNRGQIVGTFTNSTEVDQGFVYSNGTFADINVPGGLEAEPTGINNKGQIVGSYIYFVGNNGYGTGFLDTNGKFTNISFPGVFATDPLAINDQGQIVGFYEPTQNGLLTGFIYSDGVYTSLSSNPLESELINGINDRGQLVGVAYGLDGFLATPVPEPSCVRMLLGAGFLLFIRCAAVLRAAAKPIRK